MADATPFLPGLSPVAGKPLTAAQDAGNLTANGGLIALREIAMGLKLADVIAAPLPDARNPLLITHTYADMVQARMMMIAAGHEDCDDIDRRNEIIGGPDQHVGEIDDIPYRLVDERNVQFA